MIFKSLFRGAKKGVPEEKLPQLHAFVDVTVSGRGVRSVSVEEVGPERIVLGDVVGRKGERAVFVYQNAMGRFRFAATVGETHDGMTSFDLPERIEALGGGGHQKRSSVRLDTLLSGQWRMAPGGIGVGEYMRGSIRDISRGGCAIITDRLCKVGQTVEVKMSLNASAAPLTVLGEVMRAEQVPTSGKFSHGLRFHGLTPVEDRAILDFINRRTAELRSRGLA
ncbi:MAG TPA: PilZ domain-containing protein [Candidatus Baltobacteraceae bacterium]|nr:PilZ domain-containing protein [Candidatus Baltobacteraceae bacterium]